MALFSRRPKGTPPGSAADEAPETAAPVEAPADAPAQPDAGAQETPAARPEEAPAAASVDISVSSYRGLGAHTPARTTPSPAPTMSRTETVAGVRDNVLVREALARLPEPPAPQDILDVARQLLQGHLFLRVKGDARTLLSEGKQVPLAMATVGDRNFALAYSSGAALQASVHADGDLDTSAMGQPVVTVLRHVVAGPYEGLILDHASAPARAVFPRALLEKLLENFDEALTVKTLLAAERTPATAGVVAQALTRVPLWVAVGRGEDGKPGIAEGRSADGSRLLEIYSHPLEVAAMRRADRAAPLTGAQLGVALRGNEELSGVIVDPRGPWIKLSREELAPVISLGA
jgi:hypothetical protein